MLNYHIIGIRKDGSRLILLTTPRQEHAERRAEQFHKMLKGYGSISVETDQCTNPEVAMPQTSGDRPGTPKRLPTPGGEGDDPKPWGQLNRLERDAAVRGLLQELGPQTGAAEIVNAGKSRGMAIDAAAVYRMRSYIARDSKQGPKARAKTARPSRDPSRAHAPVPHEPATPSGELLVPAGAIGPFLAACHKLGGFKVARQVLNEVAAWQEGEP